MPTGTGSARAVTLAALLLAPALAGAAEVTLQARVDQAEIAQDDVVTLEIRLESPAPPSSWDLPTGPDFELVNEARSQDSSITLGGGGGGVQIRTAYGITRVLRPRRAGSLTIPSMTAVVAKRKYVTQPIVVKVSAGGGGGGARPPGAAPQAPPRRGGWAYQNLRKDVALEARVQPREVYLGEQLTAEYWMVVPYPIEAYASASAPKLDGFWQEALDTPRTLGAEQRGDRLWYLVHRVALFPSRTGELTVDPLELHDVMIPVRGFGPFGDVERFDLRSTPIKVKVKPLPPHPPAGFAPSNVGALSLEVTATPDHVAVGEPVTVRMTVRGDGNLRALSLPRLPDVPGARVFQPSSKEKSEERSGRLFGTRTVETVLVPDRPGELALPGLEWPYFDPKAGKYQTVMTPALRIAVAPAAPTPPPRAAAPALAAAGLHGIRADASLRRAGPPAWLRLWFLALLALPPLAFAALVAADRLGAGGDGTRASRAAARSARRRLAAARRKVARDPAAATGEVERALLGYATGRLGHPAAGLTREELAAAMARAGAHPPAVRALLQALELVDASRYGAGDALGEEVLTAAERALAALDEADWQPDREVMP